MSLSNNNTKREIWPKVLAILGFLLASFYFGFMLHIAFWSIIEYSFSYNPNPLFLCMNCSIGWLPFAFYVIVTAKFRKRQPGQWKRIVNLLSLAFLINLFLFILFSITDFFEGDVWLRSLQAANLAGGILFLLAVFSKKGQNYIDNRVTLSKTPSVDTYVFIAFVSGILGIVIFLYILVNI